MSDHPPHDNLDAFPAGSIKMKRDMDLVRRILLAVEAKPGLAPEQIVLDGADAETLGRHVEMLFDLGYIEGAAISAMGQTYRTILVTDLSWEGHDFVGAIHDEGVWSRVKDAFGAAELSRQSLKVIKDVAIAAATAYAKSRLGL